MSKPSIEDALENFKKINRIGSGSYSVVFKARNNKNQIVALKKYIDNEDNGISEVTIREMAILKLSNHPNIIEMLWFDTLKFKHITMRLYEYELNKFIYKKTLNTDLIRDISYQILRGIYYLHSHSITHRDIKPQNIMIHQDTDDRIGVVLIDMGLGRKFDIVDRTSPKTNQVCTLWYRSPEILLGYKDYHFELDIWSVGCIIGEMCLEISILPGDIESDQLYQTFRLLGTPTDDSWPGVTKLSNYKSNFPKFKGNFDERFDLVDPALASLVKSMLVMNPIKRPMIHEILKYPIFNSVSKYITVSYKDKVIDYRERWIDIMTNWPSEPLHNSLINQSNITRNMRIILLGWLSQVCSECDVSLNSFIRAQNIIDMVLSRVKKIQTEWLQLLGIVALWISDKIHSVFFVQIDYLVWLSDGSCTSDEIINMEKIILRLLDLKLYFPISCEFVSTYKQQLGCCLDGGSGGDDGLSCSDGDKPTPTNTDQTDEINFVLMYITFNLDLMKYHPSVLSLCVCLYVTGGSNTDNYSDDITNCMAEMKIWLDRGINKNLSCLKKDISHILKLSGAEKYQ